jgi:hypothetical protein
MSDRRASLVVCEPAALLLAHVKHLSFVLVAVVVFHAPSTTMYTNAGQYYSYVQAARNIHHKYDNCFTGVGRGIEKKNYEGNLYGVNKRMVIVT